MKFELDVDPRQWVFGIAVSWGGEPRFCIHALCLNLNWYPDDHLPF